MTSGFSYEEINEPYYFESDHVALKENPDYHNLLHTIALLEAQRQQAAQDIEVLYKVQEEALTDPLAFVQQLQKGTELNWPKMQQIASLPEIHWDKYTSSANFSSFGARHMTRNKKNAPENNGATDQMQSLKSRLIQGITATATNSNDRSGSDSELVVVRGRTKDSSKPQTFNQLWTEEEQQRLESLLIQFPPEEIESRRWAKIAEALGNRTPVQVASRVQKYFVRLAKEGLPVPGRMPNLTAYSKKGSHRHHRYNRMYYPSSTLMNSHIPPVWMKEDGEDCSISVFNSYSFVSSTTENSQTSETNSQKDDSSDEEMYPGEIINSPEYQELQRLKQLRKEKLLLMNSSVARHIGFKCDNCGCEPIVGTRWHCIDCPSDLSLDFCEDCSGVSIQQGKHDSTHRLHPFKHAVLDSDYMSYSKAHYNYLDPNYMPAS
ncbi:ZZ-type zinc finger-containing protein 3-like isoform X1 [Biomphalaria glabrata]|uniref:ZZ-type zinc finger-containing protein 3-like isoform X1 n=1 Tax=Biomphalaria glabrata TaxID=6526 RepID=A0A9U8EIM3_BIOGL|nr:ZZ-type zinc finger-containing protein 3-like isoform X1 [Biomphalaria glabrata]XP_013089210.2 ZZ-type zinc finger-containing protein 3-like isoform X1 [Biomphalaria glabrata]XP_013089211.2 ZZ-type zinc finger-containing protein 3-like isoform X1 [Biomphalaria glabrata]XP_055872455.1 ZZ-type zinc finger-containing protein 3-like isoform X1 [Biomphalaria glabrata]